MRLLGARIYDLFVTEIMGNNLYLCQCKCGTPMICTEDLLLDGKIKACGCNKKIKHKKYKRKCYPKFGPPKPRKVKHGKSNHILYKKFTGMKDRCYNSNSPGYKYYGAKGIKICQEWLDDFMSFYNWAMNNGYKKGLSIERIDSNQDYCPSNCCWIKTLENRARINNNNRTSKYIGVNKVSNNSSIKNKLWRAQIQHNKKQITIGHFKTEKEAAIAYNKKAKELRGPDAYQNTIQPLN